MKASKRDYERFVSVIQALAKSYDERKAWAGEIAHILKDTNPAFDRVKFMDACLKENT